MEKLLIKLFIKDSENVHNEKVRGNYGRLSSTVGIVVNILLSAVKFIVGTLANSIAITGDAVNNLSDAGSSVITLVSFKMSGKPADKKHPFGHARMEYIAASVVAVLILMVGVELVKSSVDKIAHPTAIEFSWLSAAVLTFSILMKLWLCKFYKGIGRRIDSSVMQATAADSLSDVMATSAVLISTFVSPLIHFQLDGYMGVTVAGFILFSGYKIVRSTIDNLIGKEPSEEFTAGIEAYILKYDGVLKIHDLVVHDYGPQRCYASVHVEVDAKENILKSHDLIDNIERDIDADMGIHLVIHLDPIVIDDPYVSRLYHETKSIVAEVEGSLSMHDFRVVKGPTHSNLIFDIVVPYECAKKDSEIVNDVTQRIQEKEGNLYAVITVDRAYVAIKNKKDLK